MAAQWGAARANHLADDSQIVTEHGRISLLKGVAELALSNLNEVEKPEEPYVFGRMIEVSQDTAVQHRYKSVIPRGAYIHNTFARRLCSVSPASHRVTEQTDPPSPPLLTGGAGREEFEGESSFCSGARGQELRGTDVLALKRTNDARDSLHNRGDLGGW